MVTKSLSSLAVLLSQSDILRERFLSQTQFEQIATQEIQRTRDEGRPLSLLSIGIDRVSSKQSSGSPPNTHALHGLAEACAGLLRGTDIIGWIDERAFIALLPATSTREAQRTAERLRTAVAGMKTPLSRGRSRRVTVSIGIVSSRTGLTSYHLLRSRADAKRSDAEGSGGNRVST